MVSLPPAPPPGWGTIPSFLPPAYPPSRRPVYVALGVVAALLVCCGGGLAGVVTVATYAYRTAQTAAVDAVDTYLGHLRRGAYPDAYALLCERLRRGQTVEAFTSRELARPRITEYRVDGELRSNEEGFVVTALVRRGVGDAGTESFPVVFEDDDAAHICG